jgi:hypothetical protein
MSPIIRSISSILLAYQSAQNIQSSAAGDLSHNLRSVLAGRL